MTLELTSCDQAARRRAYFHQGRADRELRESCFKITIDPTRVEWLDWRHHRGTIKCRTFLFLFGITLTLVPWSILFAFNTNYNLYDARVLQNEFCFSVGPLRSPRQYGIKPVGRTTTASHHGAPHHPNPEDHEFGT